MQATDQYESGQCSKSVQARAAAHQESEGNARSESGGRKEVANDSSPAIAPL
jgi:hypothetical protein